MTDSATPPDALTALLEATAQLAQSNEQQNHKIDALADHIGQATQQLSHKIDALTDQIGHLSEVVTAGFSELKAIVQKQSETADQQSDTIKSLADSVAVLVAQLNK